MLKKKNMTTQNLWEVAKQVIRGKFIAVQSSSRKKKKYQIENLTLHEPHIQGAMAARTQEGIEELPTLKVRKGSVEEIPLVQGKEQWLRFAGAAVKRYPTPKVRETQVRW